MTGIRRALVLIGLTPAVMIGAAIPASATFADSAAVATTVATATVAPATGITGKATCYDQPIPFGVQRRMAATVSWQRSTTAAVTRYRVDAVLPGQAPLQFETTQTSVSVDEVAMNAAIPVSVTVTAITSYGWSTAASPITVTTC